MMREIDILRHPKLGEAVQSQASALLSIHMAAPRLASLFATQQRWLMSHAAVAEYFLAVQAGEPGVSVSRVVDTIGYHALASRNTAATFLAEATKYGIVAEIRAGTSRRPLLKPAPATLEGILNWVLIHLGTLDVLDGGDRRSCVARQPDLLQRIHPFITEGLLASRHVREPLPTFSLFTWMDEGGIIMDRLIKGQGSPIQIEDRPCFLTDLTSISGLAAPLSLSRTHAGRKLVEAERMGSLGWTGRRGRSPIWISQAFVDEYRVAQAAKLAVLEIAFTACFPAGDAPLLAAAGRRALNGAHPG